MLLQKISQQIDGIVSRDSSTLQQYIGNTVFTLNTKLDSLATMVAGIPTATSTAYGEGQAGGKRRGTQKKRK
jgi:chorismate synthase